MTSTTTYIMNIALVVVICSSLLAPSLCVVYQSSPPTSKNKRVPDTRYPKKVETARVGSPVVFPDIPLKPDKRRDVNGDFVFRDDATSTTFGYDETTVTGRNFANKIPVSLYKKLNNINGTEFLNKFRKTYQSPIALGSLHPRGSGGALTSRTRQEEISLAESADCEPQLVPVPFDRPTDPSVIYYPFCTKVKRCGGCCSHEMFHCEPTKTETQLFKIYKGRYLGPEENVFDEGEYIDLPLEVHLECACNCRVKEKDCNERHIYLPNECRCECRNQLEARRCVGQNKFWNPDKCECLCTNMRTCSTGSVFQKTTCSCEPIGRNVERFFNPYEDLDPWGSRSRGGGSNRHRAIIIEDGDN